MINTARELIIELLYNSAPLTNAQQILVEFATAILVVAVLAVPVVIVHSFIAFVWEAFKR